MTPDASSRHRLATQAVKFALSAARMSSEMLSAEGAGGGDASLIVAG